MADTYSTLQSDSPLSDTQSHTRLQGGLLWLARVGWLLLALMSVVFVVLAFGRQSAYFGTVQPEAPWLLNGGALTEPIVLALDSLGLTAAFFQTLMTGLYGLGIVVAFAVGLLVIWRRSDDWFAMFVSAAIIVLGVGLTPSNSLVLTEMPAGLAFLTRLVATVGWVFITLFFYLFPDGRVVSRWLIPFMIFNGLISIPWNMVPNSILSPFTWPPALFFPFLIQFWGSNMLALIVRYRQTRSDRQRQQIKWVVAAVMQAGIFMILVVLAFVIVSSIGSDRMLGYFFLFMSPLATLFFLLLPVSVAVALLRSNLWDVNYVINRSLVYGAVTVGLLAVFAAVFIGLQAVLRLVIPGESAFAAGAVSAAAVVGLFNPASRRLRRFIDRRFYGIEVDYSQVARVRAAPGKDTPGSGRSSFGPYTDLTLLGRGGMGEVYRAQHPTLDRTVAIKLMPPHLEVQEEMRKRFTREAQTIAALKHPHIVTLLDFGEEDGTLYMVMEYIEGQDMSDLLKSQGRMPLTEARPLLADIASALDYAHAEGVVHRDIKPGNVMVEPHNGGGRSQRAVLMDFGIAKIYSAMTRLTGTGGMVGTLDSIAPEQIQGASTVDGRADVYSLGVLAYQLLTGALPFKHNNPGAMVMAHLMEPPPDARQVAPDLSRDAAFALQRAMAKQPDDRFATAGEFVSALS